MSRLPPIVVIGAGRAGLGLALGLKKAGYKVAAVVARRPAQAAAVTRLLGRGTGSTDLREAVSRPGLILVCVPDREIAGVARLLASMPASLLRSRVILHTSGASSDAPLRPLRKHGAFTGSLHPLVSFPQPGESCRLAGAAFAIDGDAHALRAARSLVLSLGGMPIRIAPRDRAAYHLVASLLANGLVALMDEGFGLAHRSLRMSQTRARAVFIPLLSTVLTNTARSGTHQALTGPVVRADIDTVRRHLEQLKREPPALGALYRLLALAALRMAIESKRIDKTTVAEMERVLTPH